MASTLALAVCLACAPSALAGAFVTSGAGDLDRIVHPSNYTGSGGNVQVRVCISPASSVTTELEIPLRNVIFRMNELEPTIGNLITGGANDIPSNAVDAESALLHETGHCIGLAHPNLATESGVPSAQRDYTKSTLGNNGSYDLNAGVDSVLGSSDDSRGDDVNLHWFRISNNDPFTIATVVDSTTYSVDANLLPGSDNFAANASRQVSALLSLPSTEAAMQQGQSFDEAQRTLAHDDVATLLYGASGIDEIAGTGDDYTIDLVYQGITNSGCDVTVSVDANTGFASCSFGLTSVGGDNHLRVTTGIVRLNNSTNWYYNQTPVFAAPNTPPELDFVPDQTVEENQTLNISITATDDDAGDTLDIAVAGLPGFCSFLDNEDRTADIDCAPLEGDANTYLVQVFVADDAEPIGADNQSFTLTVTPAPGVDSDGDGVFDDQDNCINTVNADQRDTNGDGFGNLCDADFNNDCVINVVDLGVLRSVFFSSDPDADLNGDGVVNVSDLGLLRAQFFGVPGPSGVTSVCD